MALNSRKVRLPELPIFRKFSLALRQEFARAEDVLQALEESRQQIKALIGEGGPAPRPGPRLPRRAELHPAGRASAQSDVEDDSPKSFLKESVADSSSGASGHAGGSPSADATAAMKPPGEEATSQKGRSSAAEKEEPAAKRTKRPARGSKRAGNQAGSTIDPEREGKGASRSRKDDDSTQPKAGPDSRKESTRTHPGEVPADQAPPSASSTEDEEREFWGDERWGKGRKGKGDKGRSGRVDIVRVGAEGRPVGGTEPPAHERK